MTNSFLQFWQFLVSIYFINANRPKTLNTGCFSVQHPVLTDSFRTVCTLFDSIKVVPRQARELFFNLPRIPNYRAETLVRGTYCRAGFLSRSGPGAGTSFLITLTSNANPFNSFTSTLNDAGIFGFFIFSPLIIAS